MAHAYRFMVGADAPDEGEAGLSAEEAHHLLHVLRMREGDAVALMDGCGRTWEGRVVSATRKGVRVSLESCARHVPPEPRLTLIQGMLHREKPLATLIQRGVEMGINRFLFFDAPRASRGRARERKWRRLAAESCKQSGRPWMPEFDAVQDLAAALDSAEQTLLVATARHAPHPLAEAVASRRSTAVIVGPEEDLSDEDLTLALERGAIPVSLGPYTLRSEVAAPLAAALIRYEWGQLETP